MHRKYITSTQWKLEDTSDVGGGDVNVAVMWSWGQSMLPPSGYY